MIDAGFYNMDCMDAMKQFPDGFFDLAIVDPPYGINVTGRHKAGAMVGGRERPFGGKHTNTNDRGGHSSKCRGVCTARQMGSCGVGSKFYHAFDDQRPPDEGYFRELERVAQKLIIWGGNYFLNYLGATKCLITWDKDRRGMDQADCEVAWTNLNDNCRIFKFRWNGMLQGDMKHKEERIHPTQKPVKLYEWLLDKYAKDGDKILDTHVGSASSLIACHRGGYQYWGFEVDETYYRMAKERLDREMAQVSIFTYKGDGTA